MMMMMMMMMTMRHGVRPAVASLRCLHARPRATRRASVPHLPRQPAARRDSPWLAATSVALCGSSMLAFVWSAGGTRDTVAPGPFAENDSESAASTPWTEGECGSKVASAVVAVLCNTGNLVGSCALYSRDARQFVTRHLRCSFANIALHRRWHTLLTSSFLCVRRSDSLLLVFVMVEMVASFRTFVESLVAGGRANTIAAAQEDNAMPRQLPFWGFLSLFASSAVVSNALELIAGTNARVSGAGPIIARASAASPLTAVLTWSLLARDQFGLALVGPAVAIVGAARGSRAMIGMLGAYAVVGLHWQRNHATRVSQQADASG